VLSGHDDRVDPQRDRSSSLRVVLASHLQSHGEQNVRFSILHETSRNHDTKESLPKNQQLTENHWLWTRTWIFGQILRRFCRQLMNLYSIFQKMPVFTFLKSTNDPRNHVVVTVKASNIPPHGNHEI
jgi:hypothetical protein